jgi:hypothetical protein
MGDPSERPGTAHARSWLWALVRVRALWPLPALLLLALMLPFVPADAWRAQYTTRRMLSRAELALLITGTGCVCYWLVLLLSGKGLLYSSRSWGMREPSDGELALVETGLRFLCLLITYAGPALLI